MVELRGLTMVLAQASCDLHLKEALKAQKSKNILDRVCVQPQLSRIS